MVVGLGLDESGMPICCEMWPGNTANVNTLQPIVEHLRNRFGIVDFCVVADWGMVSEETIDQLEEKNIPYILEVRMRRVKEIGDQLLIRAGIYSSPYLYYLD